jgi:hypothetical protein
MTWAVLIPLHKHFYGSTEDEFWNLTQHQFNRDMRAIVDIMDLFKGTGGSGEQRQAITDTDLDERELAGYGLKPTPTKPGN